MVTLNNVSKSFGSLKVFENFSVSFDDNKINTVLGANGCGKTTMLRLISRLEKPDAGEITAPDGISYVFQEDRLLPFLTAENNIDFVLKYFYKDKAKRKEIIDKYLKIASLEDFRDYYPEKLSGGMKRRLSLARAFAYPSELLLLDEPFKGLDINKTEDLKNYILRLNEESKRTIIFVTHNVDEALLISDKILILGGKPLKVTDEIYTDSDKDLRKAGDENLQELRSRLIWTMKGW